jgi:FkbM family methyltransferase
MAGSLSISLGNFLYKNCFPLYKLMYKAFKDKQDAFEISLMKTYIRPGNTVLDIGANIGFYANVLSACVGEKGQVHCFEPDTTNFKHLQNNCGKLANVKLNNVAVADKAQTLKIYTSKELNVDHRTYKPDNYDQEIDIPAIAIDEYMRDKPVNFIKMDIQGFEMSAVKGMLNVLKQNDLKMLSEFWPYGMRKAGTSILDYYTFLQQQGFVIYLIEQKQLLQLTEDKVKSMMDLPVEHYMNIFASKTHV